jgi:hypothetical protein
MVDGIVALCLRAAPIVVAEHFFCKSRQACYRFGTEIGLQTPLRVVVGKVYNFP